MNHITKVLILSILLNITVLFVIPYTEVGGDWFYQAVSLPIQFQSGDWTPPQDRTPLYGLVFSFINPSPIHYYWFTQIVSIILSSLYLIPSYLIAKKLFTERVAQLSTLFMIFTPFMIFQTGYTWPKNISMFFILFAIYFIFLSNFNHKYIISGLLLGIGFLFHNYTGLYIITILIMMIYYKTNHRLTVLSSLIITLIPYFIWTYLYYGTISTSRFIYYPISIEYCAPMIQSTDQILEIFLSTPIIEIITPHISNLLVTATPAILFASGLKTFDWLYYYTHTYMGGLSTAMYIIVVYAFFKKDTNKFLRISVLIPIVLIVLLYGWKEWGLLPPGLQPTIPFLVMIGINEVKNNKFIIVLLFILAIADTIIFITLYQQFFITINGTADISTLLEPYNVSIENFKSLYYLKP